MDSWRQGRDDLLEELTRICSRIDTNIGAELDSDNSTSIARDELESLRQKSALVEYLVDENARLAQEYKEHQEESLRTEALEKENKRLSKALDQAERNHNISIHMGPSHARGSPTIAATPNDLRYPARRAEEIDSTTKEKYNSLVARFNKLHENHKEVKEANRELKANYVQQKNLTKSWRAHADSLRARAVHKDSMIETLRARVEYLGDTVKDAIPRAASPLQSVGSKELSPSTSGVQGEIPAIKGTGYDNASHEHSVISDTEFEPFEPHNSSTTQDDETLPPKKQDTGSHTTKEATSHQLHRPSDSPVVVSSRRVNKRRSTKHTEQSPSVKVKIEALSSSPIGLAALRDLGHGESIDLDEIGNKINTPKKLCHELELYRQASKLSNESQSNGGSLSQRQNIYIDTCLPKHKTATHGSGPGKPGHPLQPLSPNRLVLSQTSDLKVSNKRRRLAIERAVENLGEDGQNVSTHEKVRKENTPVANSRLESLLGAPSPAKSVLSPAQMDRSYNPHNLHLLASLSIPATSRLAFEMNASPHQEELGHSCPEEPTPYSDPLLPKTKSPYSTAAELVKSTFKTKGEKRKLIKVLRPANDLTKAVANSMIPTSEEANKSPIEHYRPLSKRVEGSLNLRAAAEQPPWDDTPENEPLRCRELRMLSLQDFRINPAHNQGYNYAFTDVVRNRGDRQCLPGCTKPECCGGKFRALARMMEDRGIGPTSSQEEANEKLIEEFLGDNSHKLWNMSKEEKQELLLQAKARELSNQYGRHRHAYERRKSPPGFWDADFPTTQEQMTEREKAYELERELVAKRYEEAMRPGGAYIFRDE